jgi:hypothetical protein
VLENSESAIFFQIPDLTVDYLGNVQFLTILEGDTGFHQKTAERDT